MSLKEKKALWDALCEWRRLMDDRGWLFFTGTYADCADRHARLVGHKDMYEAVSVFRWV